MTCELFLPQKRRQCRFPAVKGERFCTLVGVSTHLEAAWEVFLRMVWTWPESVLGIPVAEFGPPCKPCKLHGCAPGVLPSRYGL